MTTQEQIEKWIDQSPDSRFLQEIREENQKLDRTLVVLDDDPTGTQTVHNLPVITSWNVNLLVELFQDETPIFYVLTNSRSLTAARASELVKTIGRNLNTASQTTGRDYDIILRSDSTLRGHHPEEMDAILECTDRKPELNVLHPAFIEGGRVTFDAVHYAKEGTEYIPCGDTQYARDASFSYSTSDLRDWVAEKTDGRVPKSQISRLHLEHIRRSSVEELTREIAGVEKGNYLLADAVSYHDIDKFCLALLRSKRTFIARTAASFVASMGGIDERPLLSHEELQYHSENGGLIIAGSYVDKTTRQINSLIAKSDITPMVIDVKELLAHDDYQSYLNEWVRSVNNHIKNDRNLLIYTSREVITADNSESHLDIGNTISTFISDLVGALDVVPSFLIAKGGITSSDIATKSLKVVRARVMGQILPGIPVWELGKESKYPAMPYVIFPGNVGDDAALYHAFKRIKNR